ncbi:MAG: WecB/TagA/CpsF family glycosyltransferase [Chitinophagaceae bacterium]|nr:WecB/TagA/CpsF family glycosyltransferase [Chitinophagaceae bacterium]
MSITKLSVFGINYAAIDYTIATDYIIASAVKREQCGVSALAVHGLMEAYNNPEFRERVNKLDLVVPDGQPIRWAMNLLYNCRLKDRVYGPDLTVKVLERANELGLAVFLFGSKAATLQLLSKNILAKYPAIKIVGMQADRFREATDEEDLADIQLINSLNPNLVLVGRGCPRQEKWVSDHLESIKIPMMAVGAAFDFLAGTLDQAPKWMQRNGLEWLYRLYKEPGRLWKRYLFTNTQFLFLFIRAFLFKRFR